MSGSTEIQALVNYYARVGYARHIQTVCAEVLRKRAGDPQLQFWKTYGVIMEGSYSEVRARAACNCSHRTWGRRRMRDTRGRGVATQPGDVFPEIHPW